MPGIYDRQEKLELNLPEKIAVVGVGGVGFWVGLLSALSGVKQIILIDEDYIEETNLNRLPLPISAIGRKKVDVARELIIKLRPDAIVFAYPQKFFPPMVSSVNVIIDCTDDINAQRELYKFASENRITFIRAGYDGVHVTLANKVSQWGEGDGRYTVVPSWICPAVNLATLVVGKMMKYPDFEFSGDFIKEEK